METLLNRKSIWAEKHLAQIKSENYSTLGDKLTALTSSSIDIIDIKLLM